MRPAAGPGVAARLRSVPPGVLLRSALPISGGQLDLELIELIPLGIGPLPLWNRQERLQAGTGGNRLRFIHGRIISSFWKMGWDSNFQETPARGGSIQPQADAP
jgi:hypothetical protein